MMPPPPPPGRTIKLLHKILKKNLNKDFPKRNLAVQIN